MIDQFSLAKYSIIYDEKKVNLDEEIKKSTIPLILFFTAKWCGPCKVIFPILEKKLEEQKNFKVIKIETDKYEDLSSDYDVSVLPSFYLYYN